MEVGSGTGVMTRALLDLIPSDTTLLAFEINHRFCHYIRSVVSDQRLVLINSSATRLEEEVRRRGYTRVDAVVSSLALAFLSDWQRHTFLTEIGSLLGEKGVFTQFQYFHGLQVEDGQLKRFRLEDLLRRHFSSVRRKIIWRNLPPAFVFICRKPLRAAQPAHRNPGSGRT